MKNIGISVIIPAYNAKDYIKDCLNSILNQTYNNIEIIVVDDCSTDNTVEIVKSIDSNIKLFSTPKNSRQGAARNIGIDHATGDYILFVDSDDTLSNNQIIEKVVHKLEEENNPDILYLGFKMVGRRDLEIIPDEENTQKPFRLGENKYINVFSICWKTDLVKSNNIRFLEGIMYEDVYFCFLGMEKAKTYSYMSDIFYIYNNRDDSTTTNYTFNQARDTIILISKLFELFDVIDEENKPYLEQRINQQAARAKVRLDRALESNFEKKKRAN